MIADYTAAAPKILHNITRPVQKGASRRIVIVRSRATFPQVENGFIPLLGNDFMNRQLFTPIRASGDFVARMMRLRLVGRRRFVSRRRRAAHRAYLYPRATCALVVARNVDGTFYVRIFGMKFRLVQMRQRG
jgi:hypothetical protein